MGNVLRVWARDVRRILHAPASWAVVLFLCVLPSLYTWFNVYGFWNPYDNTGELRICVVNEDAGVDDDLLGHLDVGTQVVDQLHENTQLGWTFVTREEALSEVQAGTAYAAFIIPEDFSESIASLTTGEFRHAQLEYYLNEKVGPVSPKVTDTGAGSLETTINDSFVSTVSEVVATVIDEALAQSEVDVAVARDGAVAQVDQAVEKIDAAALALTSLTATATEAAAKADEVTEALEAAKTQVDSAAQGLADTASVLSSIAQELPTLDAEARSALDTASASVSQSSTQADVAIGTAAGAIAAVQGDVDAALTMARTATEQNERIIRAGEDVAASLPEGAAKQTVTQAVSSLRTQNSQMQRSVENLSELSDGVQRTSVAVADETTRVNDAVQQTVKNMDAYRSTFSQDTVPAATEGLLEIANDTAQLSGNVAAVQQLLTQTQTVVDSLKRTLTVSSDSLDQTATLLEELGADMTTVRSDIAAISSATTLGSLLGEDGHIDPDAVADFMMSPTQVQQENLYPLNAYGSAMAPLFINLTLWIGVFMLMVIFRLEVDGEGIEHLTITQRFLGRELLLVPLVVVQACICIAGCLIIGVQTVNAPLLFLTASFIALAYLSLQYTLSSCLQHVGKGICIILVFLQIPGATGLYPIEMTPAFFHYVYPLFPFTYGINAMREVISGFYGNDWLYYMGVLLGFLVAFQLIGTFIRPFLTNTNRLFARQLGESDLLIGEEVRLPERRYQISQIIRVLSDHDEYKERLESNARLFMNLYPKLKRGALIVGIAVPLVLTITFAVTETEKVVMLTMWLIWLCVVIIFLVVVEHMKDSLERQTALEAMSDEEVRALFAQRNKLSHRRAVVDDELLPQDEEVQS